MMKLRKELKKFEALRNAVTYDGKIDIYEAEEIKKIITPYCRSKNRKCFIDLLRLLLIAKDDGTITELESTAIIAALDEVVTVLNAKLKIELLLTTITFLISAAALTYWFIF